MNSLNNLYAINIRQEGIRNFGKGFLVAITGLGTGKAYGLIIRVERLLDKEVSERNVYFTSQYY